MKYIILQTSNCNKIFENHISLILNFDKMTNFAVLLKPIEKHGAHATANYNYIN